MEPLPFISTPYTEHWVAWTVFSLLLAIVLVKVFEPTLYVRAFSSLLGTKERDSIFVGSGVNLKSILVLILYGIVVLALVVQWILSEEKGFDLGDFGILAAIVVAMLLVRYVMQGVTAFIFYKGDTLTSFRRHYMYLNVCLVLLLFPVVLLAFFTHVPHTIVTIIISTLLILYLLLLIYKILVLLPLSLYTLLYLPLYILTVEILPLLLMLYVAAVIY